MISSNHCYYDIETRSPEPITHGSDRYFTPAEYLIGTFARDDDKPQLWDRIGGEPVPRDLADALADPSCVFVAHNAAFDRGGSHRLAGWRTPISRWRCTMAQAAAHGYPQSLGTLGEVLELPESLRKLSTGVNLIQRFCIPHNDAGDYFDRLSHPSDWDDFCEYNLQDTIALREIHKRLPKVNYQGENLEAWWINELINERGFCFDQDLAHAARKLLDSQKARHERDMIERTEGAVQAATQRDKLKRYLESKGLVLPNMRASTISEMLEHDDISPEVRYLLEARLEASKSSGAKYLRGLNMVGEGSRVRYAIRFSGAGRTGRFSGRGFQPHNMQRPVTYITKPDGTRSKKPVKAETILNLTVPGIKAGKVLDNEIVYGGPNEACANALRCAIVAATGNELVVADWSNIEGRILAWVSEETWKLDAYKAQDRGEGVDSYKLLVHKFIGLSLADIDDIWRQIGKVIDLSCGYLAGVGAFVTMANAYEIDLDALVPLVAPRATEKQLKKAHTAWRRAFLEGEDYELEPKTYQTCDILKQWYREANQAIYKTGQAVGRACLDAVREPGRVYTVAKCRIWATSSFLIIQMPSGRRLLYAKPHIEQDAHMDPETGEISHRDYITYLTARGKGWIRERAWSGLFIENIVQAIANDVLRAALRAVHADALTVGAIASYLHLVEGSETALALHVHDEVVLDVPKGSYALSRLIELITTKLVASTPWMRNLPLAAAGWVGPTYHKG